MSQDEKAEQIIRMAAQEKYIQEQEVLFKPIEIIVERALKILKEQIVNGEDICDFNISSNESESIKDYYGSLYTITGEPIMFLGMNLKVV